MKGATFDWCTSRAIVLLFLLPSIFGSAIGKEDNDSLNQLRRNAISSDMAAFLEGYKPNSVASDLAALLQKYDLTTSALANMIAGTETPSRPLDSSSGNGVFDAREDPQSWRAQVVTPIQQGVEGQLVQAVLYTNEFRNPNNPQRVLSFAGVQVVDARKKEALADGACLEAAYSFKETEAEGSWQMICMQSGYKVPDMAEWATQISELVQSTNATFLTGYKQGCEIAKSEGLLNPSLPVVCWGTTGTLTEAWIESYPGLAQAIGLVNNEEENSDILESIPTDNAGATGGIGATNGIVGGVMANPTDQTDPTIATTLHQHDNFAVQRSSKTKEKLTGVYLPKNHQIYVLQTYTDPSSNCLLPPEAPGKGLANVCAYSAGSRCDPFNGTPRFDYSIFSMCSEMATLPILLQSNLPVAFREADCVARKDVGIDHHLKDCPFHEMPTVPPKSPFRWGVEERDEASMATTTAAWYPMAMTVLVTALYLLQ